MLSLETDESLMKRERKRQTDIEKRRRKEAMAEICLIC